MKARYRPKAQILSFSLSHSHSLFLSHFLSLSLARLITTIRIYN